MKYRIKEKIHMDGNSTFTPQIRRMFIWETWWNNPMDKMTMVFETKDKAMKFIQKRKKEHRRTTTTKRIIHKV